MENVDKFQEECTKGQKWVVGIIVGRVILQCLAILVAILREQKLETQLVSCVIWGFLLVKLYGGRDWARYIFVVLNIIGAVADLYLFMMITTASYFNIEILILIIFVILSLIYFIGSSIMLIKNKYVNIFLEYQK